MEKVSIVIPSIFLLILSVFGSFFISTVYHELQHTKDIKADAICWDYTKETVAYVYGYTNKTTEELIQRHFYIYHTEGVILGILFMLSLLSFILVVR